jgi:putative selenium metabolism protein SsnA
MEGHAVRINQNFIERIEKEERLLEQYPSDEKINANGQILMPGLICAHTHFYGVFSRGMAIHGEAPANFLEILQKLWWPLDQSLLEEDIYYSAMVCLIDAIKHGTTTVFDHHASPNFIDGSLDVIEKAVRKSGLRASLCYEVTDRGGTEKADAGIRENLRMIQKLGEKNEDRMVTASFGLHAGVTLSDKTLEKCAEAIPEGHGFHIHVAEDKIDEKESEKLYGVNVVTRLNQFKITGENSIFVHGVHLNDDEIDTIHQTGTWLTHQPRSNMNNAVGMANVEKMVQRGIPICMGNDGFSFSMWDEWRTCYLAHKLWSQDPRRMGADQVVDIAAYNNARMATKFFNGKIGVIQEGALADLILVDYTPITSMHAGNLPWHIIFGFRDSMVTMTMVNGKVLMRDRKLTEINEHEVCEGAQRSSAAVWERYKKQF